MKLRREEKEYQNKNAELTLESVSTLISVVMFLFFNWVLTSAKNSSPFLVPDDVIACSSRIQILTINCILKATTIKVKDDQIGSTIRIILTGVTAPLHLTCYSTYFSSSLDFNIVNAKYMA